MQLKTKIIVYIGLLSAIASILMYFPHFPILASFPFLRIDFSDVPALLASVTIAPLAGVVVELIKNLIHLLVSETAFIGELSNFIVGTAFVLSAGILAKYAFKNTLMKKKLIVVLVFSILVQIAVALLSNYFIIGPLYFGGRNKDVLDFVLLGALPFNFIKDALQAIVFYALYSVVGPRMRKSLYLFR